MTSASLVGVRIRLEVIRVLVRDSQMNHCAKRGTNWHENQLNTTYKCAPWSLVICLVCCEMKLDMKYVVVTVEYVEHDKSNGDDGAAKNLMDGRRAFNIFVLIIY